MPSFCFLDDLKFVVINFIIFLPVNNNFLIHCKFMYNIQDLASASSLGLYFDKKIEMRSYDCRIWSHQTL